MKCKDIFGTGSKNDLVIKFKSLVPSFENEPIVKFKYLVQVGNTNHD